jgi:uncharacterized membrane protein
VLVVDLLSAQIPIPWSFASWLAAAGLLGYIAFRARWGMLKDPADLNVFIGACVAVFALWHVKAGIEPGLTLHLLGATVLSLMFRPLLALFAIGIVTAATAVWSGQYGAFGLNWVVAGVLPVTVSWFIHRLVVRFLPPHLFVYLFLNAFANGAITMLAVGSGATLFWLAIGTYPAEHLVGEYLPFYILMAWGEAFMTGAAVTLIVVWKPQWIATFNDEHYLLGK